MSDDDRDYIRAAIIGAALATGAARIQCPDFPRCRYAVTSKDRAEAEAAMADHLANSARHTGGEWIDRDGRDRVGLEYA